MNTTKMNTEWQPIETAPKEHGKYIIVCYYWNEEPHEQCVGFTSWSELIQNWDWSAYLYDYLKITHWMPLPQPPQK